MGDEGPCTHQAVALEVVVSAHIVLLSPSLCDEGQREAEEETFAYIQSRWQPKVQKHCHAKTAYPKKTPGTPMIIICASAAVGMISRVGWLKTR